MPYDLFISYARPDNLDGRVIELVERIAAEDCQFSGEELLYFYDNHDIQGMEDWRAARLGSTASAYPDRR